MKGAALCVLVFGSMKLVTSFRSLRTVVDGRGIGCRLRISQFSVSLCSASAQTGGEGGLVSTAQARRTRLTTTGGLKGLPVVTPAAELLAHAIRKSKKISQDMEIKNARNRARKWAAQRMDALSQEISRPLRDVLRMYKHQIPILHPFEATVADLTVQAMENRGERTLSAVLHDVNELRKAAMVIGKAAAAKAKSMEKKQDILEVMDNGYAAIEELFQQDGHAIHDLMLIQRQLRYIPIVQLHVPTVVLVGAPNVGKSSIVRALSSGTPEVNNYPFTTRGMTLGHLYHPGLLESVQMMDTPGVLSRPDEERNIMEQLTLASMQHLPTAVMFVMDLSGQCGEQSSLKKQIKVRNELRKRFPRRPWVDVISKADLPREGYQEAIKSLHEGHINVSVKTEEGLDALKERVFVMMDTIHTILHEEKPTEDISVS